MNKKATVVLENCCCAFRHRSTGSGFTRLPCPCLVGGAELNVATALARWYVPVEYSTALPDNYLTREICEHLEQKEISTQTSSLFG